MKILKLISASILITLFLAATANAAKENDDRLKVDKIEKSSIGKDCKADKETCKKMMKEKKKMLKKNNKSKAQDYNSSRSNTGSISKDVSDKKSKKEKYKMKMKAKKKALCDKKKDKNCKEFGQSNKKKDDKK